MTDWFDTFFDALAHDVWDGLVSDDASDHEAEWLAARLGLAQVHDLVLLDVPSGRGRLATRIAARGHDVVAVDFAVAAVEPLAANPPPRVTARLGDMRDLAAVLPGPTAFDGAWCMGNSFGYLDATATDRFLAGVARVLRPGSHFLIDVATAAESMLPHLDTGDISERGDPERHEVGDVSLTNSHRYDARTSTLVTHMVLEHGRERAERVVRHRVMTCREVVDALARAGFALERIDGDLDGRPFALGAPRCLVSAVRVDDASRSAGRA
jgi:SAM-dependent methyltransferase